MHPVFQQYRENAPYWCKQLVSNAIDVLLPEKALALDGPNSLLTTLTHQAEKERYVLHLLHYIPERRGEAFDVEDTRWRYSLMNWGHDPLKE